MIASGSFALKAAMKRSSSALTVRPRIRIGGRTDHHGQQDDRRAADKAGAGIDFDADRRVVEIGFVPPTIFRRRIGIGVKRLCDLIEIYSADGLKPVAP